MSVDLREVINIFKKNEEDTSPRLPVGKYKNAFIKSLFDKQYLLWFVKNQEIITKYPHLRQPIWDRIKELPKLEKSETTQ